MTARSGSPNCRDGSRVAQVHAVEPRDGLGEGCGPRLDVSLFDEPIALHRPDHGGVERNRREIEGRLAAGQSLRRVAALDVRRACAPPAGYLQAEIIHGLAMCQGSSAIGEAALPVPEPIGSGAQSEEGAARPADVAARLEDGEGLPSGLPSLRAIRRWSSTDHLAHIARTEPRQSDCLVTCLGQPRWRRSRPGGQDQQSGSTGQRTDQVLEKLVGTGVEPVDVLDDDDERLAVSGAEENRAEGAERALTKPGRREAIQDFLRRGDTEKVSEQDRWLLVVDTERLEAPGNCISNFASARALAHMEGTPQQFEDRVIRHLAPVRETRRLQVASAERFDRRRNS